MRSGTPVARALTIAGSDSGGGAGIQADLKTFFALGVFGMSAITAVTAQNTRDVTGVYPLSPEAVAAQIDAVADDLGVDAAKTGMLFSRAIIEAVAERVRKHRIERLVVDPVMVAKGGAPLLQDEAVQAYLDAILPLALVVTPNLPEAERLTGRAIRTRADKLRAAEALYSRGARHVVIKGGHEEGPVVEDVFFDGARAVVFKKKRTATKNTHGTGCTFSAAIAAELAKGADVFQAVFTAERFIDAAIRSALPLGSGHGPTNHWAYGALRPAATLSAEAAPEVEWEDVQ
ncbi:MULTISPECIES: bifunctional hydroxymethylpyrimidine kinase/phosphomethylpyrimidine kinase [Hydrogenibacillus]|uniref:Hydroxymethylpyrimidine/phosphomethylpyrimidine kinase n=1 Tax=Hydrogenibacillus schlegelii TaxID=1484 RepID=A0A2T5GCJ8_HYDSH|nr:MULTISPECIES: bifunctional hydroxymethylpyrimidine kinase/phosphomethylpyrimidine kinase [Hydrogenibacillus]MBT9281757.1 bifunctional hydroxymethylpyrimidine kinase/phosphomethylpyrimidine kinase [Hydrogenibacillus schlegelii]PTQ53895.1 MAG: Hydroxymethylpyrimidine phosphate kinase ThiD [Hydrogenibacillus schlegelii]QZA32670.1 bifunctional hydroxymethylpyrimidine kinase/phosphomethylpyrimidine kinase [Hydrogenibacillus sp. N12]